MIKIKLEDEKVIIRTFCNGILVRIEALNIVDIEYIYLPYEKNQIYFICDESDFDGCQFIEKNGSNGDEFDLLIKEIRKRYKSVKNVANGEIFRKR